MIPSISRQKRAAYPCRAIQSNAISIKLPSFYVHKTVAQEKLADTTLFRSLIITVAKSSERFSKQAAGQLDTILGTCCNFPALPSDMPAHEALRLLLKGGSPHRQIDDRGDYDPVIAERNKTPSLQQSQKSPYRERCAQERDHQPRNKKG